MTDYGAVRADMSFRKLNEYGFSIVFEKRSHWYSTLTRLLKVFGILVPASIGTLALSYEYSSLRPIIGIAIPITIILFVISIFAILYDWDGELSYSYESYQSHIHIFNRLKNLLNGEIDDNAVNEYNILQAEIIARVHQDSKHAIKDWELRRGMRYALREHRWECEGCKKKPLSVESTNCDVCGKYSFKDKIKSLL
jgi:mobilome CxxCx(11)CxxC protein